MQDRIFRIELIVNSHIFRNWLIDHIFEFAHYFCGIKYAVIATLFFTRGHCSENCRDVYKRQGYADYVEILPGVMPKIVKRIASYSAAPLIAGGLISDKDDVISMLQAGATAISTTCEDVWFM